MSGTPVLLPGFADALRAIYADPRCAAKNGRFERRIAAFCRMALGEDVCKRIDARRPISPRHKKGISK